MPLISVSIYDALVDESYDGTKALVSFDMGVVAQGSLFCVSYWAQRDNGIFNPIPNVTVAGSIDGETFVNVTGVTTDDGLDPVDGQSRTRTVLFMPCRTISVYPFYDKENFADPVQFSLILNYADDPRSLGAPKYTFDQCRSLITP